MKHTSGPWMPEKSDEPLRGVWLQDSKGEYVALACKCETIDQEQANSRLIAAAPEMYELLEDIGGKITPWRTRIKSLLDKIENEK